MNNPMNPSPVSVPTPAADTGCQGLCPENFSYADRLMREALNRGVFPGAVLAVANDQHLLFLKAYGCTDLLSHRCVTPATVFDLASVTKALATTLAVMILLKRGCLDLGQPLGDLLPLFGHTEKAAITVEQLLRHTSGLAAHRPFFQVLVHAPPDGRRDLLMTLVRDDPLENPIGAATLYSDLGFMVLGWIVEALAGQRLDRFVGETVYRPLALTDVFFVDVNGPIPARDFAATEVCSWRRRLLTGQVHDDNAWAAGGICGHAGLFGTAADVVALARELLATHGGRGRGILEPHSVKRFTRKSRPDQRPLGFDAPDVMDASCGHHFSPDSFGHLGFTGTSFWVDPLQRAIVVLLTNRVHPSRTNSAIKAFRPLLHDAVMEALAG
jgi:CubicO group peptidase (beta-lactamase class C family)